MSAVKMISITIPEDLDARAVAEARRRGISKSELIRVGLYALLPPEPQPTAESDPWRSLSGFGSTHLDIEPGEIDEVVYGA